MTDRPILFSAPMVRAIIREIEQPGTGKTESRRVILPQPVSHMLGFWRWEGRVPGGEAFIQSSEEGLAHSLLVHAVRYEIGDRLYVREAWRTESRAYDDLAPSDMGGEETVIYEADSDWKANKTVGRLRQGMHMPRWASRLTLTVTDVRVQRLQEITEADAIAEGCPVSTVPGTIGHPLCQLGFNEMGTPIFWFRKLWNGLNAARGHGWDVNPWVVAVTFTVEHSNIDLARP